MSLKGIPSFVGSDIEQSFLILGAVTKNEWEGCYKRFISEEELSPSLVQRMNKFIKNISPNNTSRISAEHWKPLMEMFDSNEHIKSSSKNTILTNYPSISDFVTMLVDASPNQKVVIERRWKTPDLIKIYLAAHQDNWEELCSVSNIELRYESQRVIEEYRKSNPSINTTEMSKLIKDYFIKTRM